MQRDREGGSAVAVAKVTGHRRPVIRALLLATAVGACALADLAATPTAHARTPAALTAVPATGSQAAVRQGEALTEADRDLLVKVKLAGLWEMPAGDMAARKGVDPRVREIGKMISQQHAELDDLVVRAARQVDVALPSQPNADQQRWLGEMAAASGAEFDQIFVDRLRAAHGKVFPAIANVRAGTRNAVVRQLAQRANGFVLTHMTLLESSGLVTYDALPLPPQPSAAAGGSGTGSAAAAAAAGAAADASTGPASFLAAPWYAGVVLPVALLLTMPRLLRSALRRRSAGRAAQDDDPPLRSVRYDRPRRLEPVRRGGASRRLDPPGRGEPMGRSEQPPKRMPSPYAELADDDPRSPRPLRTNPRVRP